MKFQEAIDLIQEGAAFSISKYDDLRLKLDELFGNAETLSLTGERQPPVLNGISELQKNNETNLVLKLSHIFLSYNRLSKN